MFLDIIHRLVFNWKQSCLYLKHNVSETGFCPRLQVKPILFGPIDRASPYFPICAFTISRNSHRARSQAKRWLFYCQSLSDYLLNGDEIFLDVGTDFLSMPSVHFTLRKFAKFSVSGPLWSTHISELKLNSVAFIPHANYTDGATAACQRS
jgi:hypothetical protein